MATFSVHGKWTSIFALASFVALIGLTAYAFAAQTSLGMWLYLFAFATMVFGFWSKEDHLAIGGITGIFVVLILDIIYRIGVLGFTVCKDTFSALYGC